MTKKAVCRTCAGVGYYPNPLERAPCPGCRGASAMNCNIFGGEGYHKPPGGGDRLAKCDCCKGVGARRGPSVPKGEFDPYHRLE